MEFHTKSLYNFISFDLNISFLTSWNFCLEIISIFSFLESHDKYLGEATIVIIALIFHVLIFCITIVFVAYYVDVFFCFIVLIFQIGIVLSNTNLNYNENKTSLVFCIISFVCFVYTIFSKKQVGKHKNLGTEEVNQIYNRYNEEGNNISNLDLNLGK